MIIRLMSNEKNIFPKLNLFAFVSGEESQKILICVKLRNRVDLLRPCYGYISGGFMCHKSIFNKPFVGETRFLNKERI